MTVDLTTQGNNVTDVPMTASESIKKFIAPNGRQFKFQQYAPNPGLFELVYADGKAGELPDSFKNQLFTKKSVAEEWLKNQLERLWEHALKNMKNSTNTKVAA